MLPNEFRHHRKTHINVKIHYKSIITRKSTNREIEDESRSNTEFVLELGLERFSHGTNPTTSPNMMNFKKYSYGIIT